MFVSFDNQLWFKTKTLSRDLSLWSVFIGPYGFMQMENYIIFMIKS